MMSITVMIASQAWRKVLPTHARNAPAKADEERGDDRRQQDRGSGAQRLERPDRRIGLVVVEGDRDRIVQTGPRHILLADRGQPKCVQTITTADTISQGSQPCQGRDGAVPGLRCRRTSVRCEFRIGRRPPDLQEQQRDDQRAERGQHVGQRVVDEVGRDELR